MIRTSETSKTMFKFTYFQAQETKKQGSQVIGNFFMNLMHLRLMNSPYLDFSSLTLINAFILES